MPGAEHRHAPVGSTTVLARRRALAVAAVAACLAADVIGVAAAANRDDGASAGVFTSIAAVAFNAGTASPSSSASPASVDGAASESSADGGETVSRPAKKPTPAPAPASAPKVVQRGTGTFTVVAVPTGAVKQVPTKGREVSYTVETEGGLGVDATDYASAVVANLTDPRGWQSRDKVRFVNVSPAQAAAGTKPDLRITLASPDTTDRLCAPLETRGQVSCHNGIRVVLNARRWLLGADAYGKDVASYRIYLVNHEVGHGIGHGHLQCAGKGKPAPVMMQQTYGLDGCTAWPWPTTKPA
ncbi:hypothetical protein BA895_18520 [Humibacillus sp. DSM 29435]|uniref:DUF3152 domain-containing protein n=1 Tax=Humibacillus sp. DSM 29435 TaxID=1869167 RepID=UPI0008720A9F|nr:DUF3152 domain-containing protein [Humibacillus sp. DSM 29435]OFE16967.1 hypothetical protein BA895_18520 [Humibacillus sp. DSM 29435]